LSSEKPTAETNTNASTTRTYVKGPRGGCLLSQRKR
jgi:hypothetical protein